MSALQSVSKSRKPRQWRHPPGYGSFTCNDALSVLSICSCNSCKWACVIASTSCTERRLDAPVDLRQMLSRQGAGVGRRGRLKIEEDQVAEAEHVLPRPQDDAAPAGSTCSRWRFRRIVETATFVFAALALAGGSSFQMESVRARKISGISSVFPGSAWSEISCTDRSDCGSNSCDTTNRCSDDTYSSTGY